MKTLAIVQARMTSTRLPGKVLMPILGRPMLALQLERMRRAASLDGIVVATTTNASDEPIVALCDREAVPCFRGSEHDVLSRYAGAAQAFGATTIVRVTSDCPLIEPVLIDQAVGIFYAAQGQLDYVSNMLEPRFPYGLAVEVLTREALEQAQRNAVQDAEREHVTPYIYWRAKQFRLKSVTCGEDLSHHRWTVDTPEDFELVSQIFAALYPQNPQFDMQQVLQLLENNPGWLEINQHIAQKIPQSTTH
jgi:spore coat polysaccharide biosynthesis protein SpsF